MPDRHPRMPRLVPQACRPPLRQRLFDEVTFSRFHDSGPDDRVSLTQEELNQGGQVTLQKLVITSWDDDGSSEYSAAAARERARLLLAVADERDRITGAAS